MRLTLRTLLGYLDDILEPRQAKELGEKISESQVAATLVARIKDVVRRRRIGAPEVSGPGSDPDPNVVAEYLDNTLAPDKVEDLERVCLDSDQHLAEVAAAHQILTLVLGEPVEIQPGLRERMYALGRVGEPEGDGAVRPAAALSPAAPAPAPAVPTAAGVESSAKLPAYIQAKTGWRRVVPFLLAIFVIGVWIGLIVSDPAHSWREWVPAPPPGGVVEPVASGGGAQQPAPPEAGTAPASPPAASSQGAVAMAAPEASSQGAVTTAEPEATASAETPPAGKAAPAGAEVAAVSPASVNPPPPPDASEPAEPGKMPPAASAVAVVPAGAPPTAAPATGAPAATPAAEVPTPTVAVDASRVLYNSNEGVLLHRAANGAWVVLPRRALARAGDELASPEPFESNLQLLDTDAELALLGARIVLRPNPADCAVAFDLDRGRIILRRSAVSTREAPVRVQLTMGTASYTVELLEPGTTCGVELTWRPSAAAPDIPQRPSFDGGLYVTAGSVRCLGPNTLPWELKGGTRLAFVASQPAPAVQTWLEPVPWMTPLSGGTLAVARQSARAFEDTFQLDLPASETIPALVENRHPRISELATETMALTDNIPALIRALSAPHQESRQAAIRGLGVWLRRSPEHGPLLHEELDRVFPDDVAAIVERLLWGYQPEQARDPVVSEQLVDWLGHSQIAVRELAFTQVRRLVGDHLTFMYHPDRTEAQRQVSIRQWKNHLRKEGALLPPMAQPATPQ